MKIFKKLTILSVSLLSTTMIGCTNINNKSNKITIKIDENAEIVGNGVEYQIYNLKEDEYTMKLSAKQYTEGYLDDEYLLNVNSIKLNDDESVKLHISEDEEGLHTLINGIGRSDLLEAFDYIDRDEATVSTIQNEKTIKLKKATPVCVFSVNPKQDSANTYDLNKNKQEFNKNKKDLVIYLTLEKN